MTGCFDFLFSFSSAILLSKMKSLFSQPLYQFSVSHVTTSTTYYHRNHVLIYNSKDFRWWNFDIQFHCTGILISKVAILGRSEIPSNQVFEGVKFMTTVKASDISVSFLTSDFLFSRMSYHKCHCRWSIKHARPSFGQQDYATENIHLSGIYAVVNQVTLRLKEIIHMFIA